MKLSHLFVFLIAPALFIGCDVVQKADGIILDKESLKPIKGIFIGQSSPDNPVDEYYTSDIHRSDSAGKFHYYYIGGSGYFQLYFYKGGYLTQKVNCGMGYRTDTIFMVKTGKQKLQL